MKTSIIFPRLQQQFAAITKARFKRLARLAEHDASKAIVVRIQTATDVSYYDVSREWQTFIEAARTVDKILALDWRTVSVAIMQG